MTIHLFRLVSVETHKLIELNKTCMAAILKALSTVMNENRRNKVFTVIKQLKLREFSKDTYRVLLIKLLYPCDLQFNVSSESDVLHSERC